MRKLVIMTDADSATGFRLAGVETLTGLDGNVAENKRLLMGLVNDDDVGIVGVNEDMYAALDEPTRLKIEKLERPIVVSIPATKQLEISEARHAFLATMIRRAIGFDIKIGGET